MAGVEKTLARRQFDEARQPLNAAGFDAETEIPVEEPKRVLPLLMRSQGAALVLMGASRHSRMRQLSLGSTTTAVLHGGRHGGANPALSVTVDDGIAAAN